MPNQTVSELTDHTSLYRRTLRVVILSQVLGGAGLAAGVAVGALLAQDMLGSESIAGLPAGLFTLGSALAAYLVGRISNVAGRRTGLALGFLTGALGAAGIVVAAVISSPALFFGCLFVYGAGTATNLQARYAGTDLAPPHRKATAVSIAMVATTFGAVAGPNLIEPTGRFAEAVGAPALSGPFMLAAVAYGAAGLVLLALLRPDPLLAARASGLATPPTRAVTARADTPIRDRRLVAGAVVMVLTQIAMIAIMTMTPVHMRSHGHGLGAVGLVIGAHIAAMFLPSLVTGVLVDRIGRMPMAVASGVTLLAAGLVAAMAPGHSMMLLTVALVLLGLGWNFGLISGTALIVDAAPPASRAVVQGKVDVLIALAGAGGGALSGVVVASTSFATLGLLGGLLALLLIPVALWTRAGSLTEPSAHTDG